MPLPGATAVEVSYYRKADAMSDPTTPTTPAPVEVAPQEPTAVAPEVVEPLGDAGKAALESERKARREADRQVKDLAAKLQAIEDRDKTEAQKLADRAAAAEAKASALELKVLRADVAAAKGVPAGLLSGTTQEEMEAAADALLVFKGATPKLPAAPPAAGQGNVGAPVGAGAPQLSQDDVKRMYAARDYEGIEKARTEGRLNAVLGIQ